MLLGRKRRRIIFAGGAEDAEGGNDAQRDENLAVQAQMVRSGAAAMTQTWYLSGEEETKPFRGAEDAHEELLDAIPEVEDDDTTSVGQTVDYTTQLKSLQTKLAAPGVDTNKVLAEILILKELKGKATSADIVGVSKKLPDNLYQSYEKQDAKISISDHIQLLDDFLTNQPAKRHVNFLYLSLKGSTLKKFRKYYAKYKKKMTYKRAVGWLLLECTHKAERLAVSKQLRTVRQGSNESFETFYTRAGDLRERLGQMGASEDNFHMRAYIEEGMHSKIMERIRFEVDHESWEYEEFVQRAMTYDKAINHAANVPQFLNAVLGEQQLAQLSDGAAQKKGNAATETAEDAALQSKIAKRANKEVAKLMAAQGFVKKKGKWIKGKWNEPNKKKSTDESERVDRTEETAVPGWAKWQQMKKLYPADMWKEREQHVETGKPAKEQRTPLFVEYGFHPRRPMDFLDGVPREERPED
eukprot:SAG11_NODE_4660_length_1817_cov_4.173458_1_plen_468_part_10